MESRCYSQVFNLTLNNFIINKLIINLWFNFFSLFLHTLSESFMKTGFENESRRKIFRGFMNKKDIYKELESRVLVMDGAVGTLLQELKLTEEDYRGERFKDSRVDQKGNNDILSLTNPGIIRHIHEQYLDAGADIILTNTFNATRISQADYHAEEFVYEMNKVSAEIARSVADKFTGRDTDKPRYVAGTLGPTNKTLSLSPDVNDPGYRAVSFDEVKDAYREQAEGLLDGGVDLFLIETVFDTLNAKAAIFAIEEALEAHNLKLPLMVSGTITDASGRTLSGQTLEAFLNSVSHVDLLSIGLNCSLGATELRPYVKELSRKSPFSLVPTRMQAFLISLGVMMRRRK